MDKELIKIVEFLDKVISLQNKIIKDMKEITKEGNALLNKEGENDGKYENLGKI